MFRLRPLGPVIGAGITGVDLGRPLTPDFRDELNRALLEWTVLFFRDQDITPEQQRAFARNWGPLETNPFIPAGDSAEVTRFARGAGMPGFEKHPAHRRDVAPGARSARSCAWSRCRLLRPLFAQAHVPQ